ncbi:hypothetical protein ACTFIW_005517 [Dictyostelium discoideum]
MTSTKTLSKKAIRKAKVSSTAKRAAEVTSDSDDAIAVQVKSKKTPHPPEYDDDDVYTTESTYVSDFEVKEKEPKKSKTLVPVKTDYEAANFKVVNVISNRNCYSAQDVIKNIEAIMSYNNVINPVYLIHGTHEVQLEYLRSILDKVSNETAVPNHNSRSRNPHDVQAEKIRADTLPELPKGSKVDLKKVRSSSIVYRKSKGHCLNCGKANHETSSCGVGPFDYRVYPICQSARKQQ